MLRARMLEVKENVKNKYGQNLLCDMCQRENESQIHIFNCIAYDDKTKDIRGRKKLPRMFGEQDLRKKSYFSSINKYK